jgi:hypothetical protein
MKLSDTALIVLNSAAGRDDRLVPRRTSVLQVADINACRSLVKLGLIEVVRAPLGAIDIVTVREDDNPMAFVIADAGFRALNLVPPGNFETVGTDAATAPHTAEHDVAAPFDAMRLGRPGGVAVAADRRRDQAAGVRG